MHRRRFLIVPVLLLAFAALGAGGVYFYGNVKNVAVGAAKPQVRCRDAAAAGSRDGMVWVPGGEYDLGDNVYPEEGPIRPVRVAGFLMDRHEVTNAQFAAFVKATSYVTEAEQPLDAKTHPDISASMRLPGAMVFIMPQQVDGMEDISQWWRYVPGANWRHPAGPGSTIAGHENFPVVEVTYHDALAYARWTGGELPNEREWEWAARAGNPHAGMDHDQPANANTWQGIFPLVNNGENGSAGLTPAGCYAPNAFGLYDMIGNVWEWTSDNFTPDHAIAAGEDFSQIGEHRPDADIAVTSYVIKGGSFLCAPNYCARYRSGAREPQEADLAASHLGFRTISRASKPWPKAMTGLDNPGSSRPDPPS